MSQKAPTAKSFCRLFDGVRVFIDKPLRPAINNEPKVRKNERQRDQESNKEPTIRCYYREAAPKNNIASATSSVRDGAAQFYCAGFRRTKNVRIVL